MTLFIFVLMCEILAAPSQCNAKIHPTNQNGIDIIWAFSTITTLLPLSDTGTNMPFPSCKPPGLLLFINLSIIELQPVLLEQLASRGLEDPLGLLQTSFHDDFHEELNSFNPLHC